MWTGVFPVHTGSGWWAQWTFTNRIGGVSESSFASFNLADHVGDDEQAVAVNRRLLASSFGEPVPQLAVMSARHGARVALADMSSIQTVEGFDGLVTTTPDLAIAALAADCVPVVLADTLAGIVAAAHCGWRGLISGIVDATVQAMKDNGATADNTTAAVGPAICGRCYGVPDERMREVGGAVPAAVSVSASGGPAVDIRAGVLGQLRARSIEALVVGGCTREDEQLYSYRRDGITGRQAAAIVLRNRNHRSV